MTLSTAALLLALAPLAAQQVGASTGPKLAASGEFDWERITPGNTGIPGDYVHHIFVDENDLPWIPAYTPFWEHGGMAHFDGEHWQTISNVDHPVIESPRFNDIVKDASGIMWIGSDHGLLRFDPAVGPKSLVRFDKSNTPLPGNQITDIAIDPNGALWIADQEFGGSSAGGLVRFDPATNEWTVWTTANGLPWGPQWPGWDWVDHVAVAPDPGGGFTVWFDGALGMATWKAGSFTWFGNNPPFNGPTTPMGLTSNNPVDELGNVWMMTNKGLARRAMDGTFTVTGYPAGLTTEVSRVSAISGGRAALGTYYSGVFVWNGSWSSLGTWGGGSHTYALIEDSQGDLWAGGIGGAAKFSNGQWQRYRLTNTGMLGYFMSTIDFDAAGNVYMNGNAGPGVGGFTIFDGTDWTCVNDFNYGLGPSWGLPSDDVESLCTRANGELALAPGGGQGLLNWDGASYQYLVPQGYSIELVEEDGAGRLWAASYLGGVWLVDGAQSVQLNASNSQLPAGDVGAILPDPVPGFVWIVTAFGVARTDGSSWLVYPRELLGLTKNSIGYHFTCGDRAEDGTLWLGTGLGLYHFDPSTGWYERFTPKNSALPSDDVDNIVIAPDGSVWCSTFDMTWPYPGGLTRFADGRSRTWSAGSSPLPHNQIATLASRPVGDSYEVWVGTASEGAAVVRPRPAAAVRR